MARVIVADHVLPGDRAPIARGAVVAADDGTILDVGTADTIVPAHAGAEVIHVKGVVFPGLVNAHTHVELSALHRRVTGGRGFLAWVDTLIALRHEIAPEEDAEAIDAAAEELVRTGTVAVGDITNSLGAVQALARRGIGGAVFHEILGQDRDVVLRRVEGLRQEVEERVPSWPTSDLAYAPAPHTLFTLHPDAVRAVLAVARRHGKRTSLHLAEHPAERRAIEGGDGPLPEWYATRTNQHPEWPRKPLFDVAEDLGALSPDVLLVHLAVARPDELARVAKAGAPTVLCPRSNMHIEGAVPPLLAILEAGIAPALGTDSLASCASLDVLCEAKDLADRFPTVPRHELVTMATWNGARALGRPDLGRIAKGARPGLVAVEGEVTGDPAAFLLANVNLPRRLVVSRTSENKS